VEFRRDVTVVECVEYDSIDVDANLWLGEGHQTIFNSEIEGRDVLRANFKDGVLRLQATSYVGVIPINEHLVVRVRPRVPIANLTRMVVDTGHSVLALSAFRDYSGRGTADEWAMDIYTNALLGYVDELLDLGFLRAYERREDEGHLPHGRLDFNRTLQRFTGRGIPNKAAYSWHERTIDTPANRCIKAALEVVHAHLSKARAKPRKGDRSKLARLAGYLRAFEEVSDDLDYRFLGDPQVLGFVPLPDPRAYYRQMLDLSVLVLSGVGIALELGGDDVQLGSLLIDTNKLFESFVRVSLSKHAAKHGLALEVLDGNAEGRVPLYDVPVSLPAPLGTALPALASSDAGMAQPDIVFRALDGSFTLVAEVKNTVHGMTANAPEVLPDRGEVHQAVTYALRYGLSFALLIHPWTKGAKGLVYVGRVRTIDVYDFRLDLSSAEAIDERLADMATTLVGLASESPTAAIPA
jgi:5-methylcytosine-specific restriction enzyme subunit McrC